MGRTLFDIRCSNILSGPSLRVMDTKTKLNKWDLIKLQREIVNKMKRVYRMGENICKQRINFQNIQTPHIAEYQKPNYPLKKWAEDLKRYFCKEDIQMAYRHMKKVLNIIIIKEMQIKTTRMCHLTPVRMAIIKKSTGNKY